MIPGGLFFGRTIKNMAWFDSIRGCCWPSAGPRLSDSERRGAAAEESVRLARTELGAATQPGFTAAGVGPSVEDRGS